MHVVSLKRSSTLPILKRDGKVDNTVMNLFGESWYVAISLVTAMSAICWLTNLRLCCRPIRKKKQGDTQRKTGIQ
jgi:hypothetical protein